MNNQSNGRRVQLYNGRTRVYPSNQASTQDGGRRSRWSPSQISSLGVKLRNKEKPYPVWLRLEHDKSEKGVRGLVENIWYDPQDKWMWCNFSMTNDPQIINKFNSGEIKATSLSYLLNTVTDEKVIQEISLTDDPDFEGATIMQTSKGEEVLFDHNRKKRNIWKLLLEPEDMDAGESSSSSSVQESTILYEHSRESNEQQQQVGLPDNPDDFAKRFETVDDAKRKEVATQLYTAALQKDRELEQMKSVLEQQKLERAKAEWVRDNIQIGRDINLTLPGYQLIPPEQRRQADEEQTAKAFTELSPYWLNILSNKNTVIQHNFQALDELQKKAVANIPISNTTTSSSFNHSTNSRGVDNLLMHNHNRNGNPSPPSQPSYPSSSSSSSSSSLMTTLFGTSNSNTTVSYQHSNQQQQQQTRVNPFNPSFNVNTYSAPSITTTTTTSSSAPLPAVKQELHDHSREKRSIYAHEGFDITKDLTKIGYLSTDSKIMIPAGNTVETVVVNHSRRMNTDMLQYERTNTKNTLAHNHRAVSSFASGIMQLGTRRGALENSLFGTNPRVCLEIAERCTRYDGHVPTNSSAAIYGTATPSDKRRAPSDRLSKETMGKWGSGSTTWGCFQHSKQRDYLPGVRAGQFGNEVVSFDAGVNGSLAHLQNFYTLVNE